MASTITTSRSVTENGLFISEHLLHSIMVVIITAGNDMRHARSGVTPIPKSDRATAIEMSDQ